MSILYVIPDTDPFLRKTSRRVRHIDSDLHALVDDMYETMVENWGIGLAAIQVGVPKRLFIYELPKRPVRGYEACPPSPKPSGNGESEVGKEPSNESQEEHEEPDAGYTGIYTVCINPRILKREGLCRRRRLPFQAWMARESRARDKGEIRGLGHKYEKIRAHSRGHGGQMCAARDRPS